MRRGFIWFLTSLMLIAFFSPASMGLASDAPWIRKANMPTTRSFFSTSVVNGIIYAIGGYDVSGLSTVEAYDPATDTWTKKADMLIPTFAPSTSVVNGIIYAIGGWNNSALSTVEAYDPATDSWTKKANMPTARLSLSTSEVNGKIYAIGGGRGWNVALPEGVVEEYTPEGVSVSPQGKLATTWGRLKQGN